jgi:hypothetical protein
MKRLTYPIGFIRIHTAMFEFNQNPISRFQWLVQAQKLNGQVLLKQKAPIQKPELCRIDQPLVANSDPVDLAVEIAIPEFEKVKEFRITGSHIVILPDERLQKGRVIGHVVEDLRRRQTVTFELCDKVLIGHGHLPLYGVNKRHGRWYRKKRAKRKNCRF